MNEATLPRDPAMLLSVINTRLRDNYPSLDALIDALDIDRDEIENKMRQIGYSYDAAANQFIAE